MYVYEWYRTLVLDCSTLLQIFISAKLGYHTCLVKHFLRSMANLRGPGKNMFCFGKQENLSLPFTNQITNILMVKPQVCLVKAMKPKPQFVLASCLLANPLTLPFFNIVTHPFSAPCEPQTRWANPPVKAVRCSASQLGRHICMMRFMTVKSCIKMWILLDIIYMAQANKPPTPPRVCPLYVRCL